MNTLMDYFIRGGELMWVLLAFSVVGAAVIVERAVVYVSERIVGLIECWRN
jgi:hypothetical protein